MKLTNLFTAFLFPLIVAAYNPFKGALRIVPGIEEQVNLSRFNLEFDPVALLESRPRNSEIYTKAMIQLQRLESEPTCHRLAAQLLMNNCKDVQEMSDEDPQLDPELRNIQNHHVESFACGLTLCDLSRAKIAVSDACAPFTPSALWRSYHGRKGKLRVSKEQTSDCIEAFGKYEQQYNNWRDNRDTALMFCRAVRLDIDKDETINLHKELTRLMAEFTEALELELGHAKQTMAARNWEMESYLESVLSSAGALKSNIQGSFEVLTNGVQDVSHTVKTALRNIADLERAMKVLLQATFQSNAEMAAEQEKMVIATTDLAASRITGLNDLADDTSVTLASMKNAIDQLIPTILELKERQDATEQQSKDLLAVLKNMTYTINDHTESIEQVSFAAKIINSELQKASAAAKFLVTIFSQPLDWALRLASITVVLYMIIKVILSVYAKNAVLVFTWLAAVLTLVWLKPWSWTWNSVGQVYDYIYDYASSITQLARETPVVIDTELA